MCRRVYEAALLAVGEHGSPKSMTRLVTVTVGVVMVVSLLSSLTVRLSSLSGEQACPPALSPPCGGEWGVGVRVLGVICE